MLLVPRHTHVSLSPQEFQPAVEFMLAYYDKIRDTGASRDFNTIGLVRTAGDSCADVLMGKLAELMFQKFIQEQYGIQLPLDFEIHDHTDGGQDIPGHHITIDIKATRIYSQYLLVEKQRLTSDVYVMVRVDMPRDLESWSVDKLRTYCDQETLIAGEVCGYARREDFWDGSADRPYVAFARGQRLIRADFFNSIPDAEWTPEGIQARMTERPQDVIRVGPELKAAMNYALPLRRLRTDWIEIICQTADLTLEEEIRAWQMAADIDSVY